MRNRRIRNSNHPRQNLDSFLDILTNTVGVLMFIGLFVSLLAVEAGTIIRTPLRSETTKIGKFFEVRNNQVFYLSDNELETEITQVYSSLPRCNPPQIPDNISYLYSLYLQEREKYQRCVSARNIRLENFVYDNGNYIVSFSDEGSLVYQANTSGLGENSRELKQNNSKFTQTLKGLNPNSNYIAFIVRPDSFETFRAARQQAWNLGYDVGWEPFPQDRVLVFGSGGRSVGVQ